MRRREVRLAFCFVVLSVFLLSVISAVDCSDSDGGRNYYEKGTISGWDVVDEQITIGSSEVVLGRNISITERYVNGKFRWDAEIEGILVDDLILDGIRLIEEETFFIILTGVDGINSMVRLKLGAINSFEDYCSSEYTAIEYYCCEDGGDYCRYDSAPIEGEGYVSHSTTLCENGCENGACIITTCVDSDGVNYYEKGTLRGNLYKSIHEGETKIISSYFLDEKECEVVSVGSNSAELVINGEELTLSEGGIRELDDGTIVGLKTIFWHPSEEGIVNSIALAFFGSSDTMYDYCDGDNLFERVCKSDNYPFTLPNVVKYPCPNGCEYGVCLKEPKEESDSDKDNESEDDQEDKNESEDDKEEKCTPHYLCVPSPSVCPDSGVQKNKCVDINRCAEDYIEEIQCEVGRCNGCELNDGCLPYGFRIETDLFEGVNNTFYLYCDYDGVLKEQKSKNVETGDWVSCQNNYECESNVCSEGECIEVGDLFEQASWLKKLGVRIVCRFIHPISEDKYQQCMAGFFGVEPSVI